jgi:hypothetical protein
MRRLRRMTLGITDRFPTRERLEALAAIDDADAQDAWLASELDRLLADPAFYDSMVEFGHSWVSIPPVAAVADLPEYGLMQARAILRCPPGTLHEGKWTTPYPDQDYRPCNGVGPDGNPAVVRRVEPWWAEGTTIEVVGFDGGENVYTQDPRYPGSEPIDCGALTSWHWQYEDVGRPMCSCGPHMVYCYPSNDTLFSWQTYHIGNPVGNRRLTWDEPARLLAHIAWHDRPLDDLIAGAYSVGPMTLQHTYVRYARRLGVVEMDENDRWWKPSRWTSPVDPHHDTTDPNAWSEFPIPDRNPLLLADRDYHFDPRTEPAGSMRGVPAAGVLTMPIFEAGMVRERIRGARALEMFACESFAPPAPTATFAPYTNDPAAGGPCITCHSRIDPASIHFKRFLRINLQYNPHPWRRGVGYDIAGIGNAHYDPVWITPTARGVYTADPWERIRRLWLPGTRMTPIDEATAMAEPESTYIDFLPPDQTLYGATSDGTVGPLGLAKLLINSGVFDRCAVRRLHERFVGRDVDPTVEAGYLESLVSAFVENDRQIRPFVRHLIQTDAFGRGL